MCAYETLAMISIDLSMLCTVENETLCFLFMEVMPHELQQTWNCGFKYTGMAHDSANIPLMNCVFLIFL